jgi:hypothetical protein
VWVVRPDRAARRTVGSPGGAQPAVVRSPAEGIAWAGCEAARSFPFENRKEKA